MPLQAGKRLGPYEIVAPLGAGGMGEVYKAHDTRLDRTVAIKILTETISGKSDARVRFEREARSIAALNHPYICILYDIGRHESTDYLVMEYLEGETLAKRLERGPIPLDSALQIAAQIANALDKAHAAGVTHRDLKPANVMITKSGAKLLDFGLAKLRERGTDRASDRTAGYLTEEGTLLGTLPYMSPEQLEGEDAGPPADIWALGALLYEMVTGVRAFSGKSQASLISAIMTAAVRPPSQLQQLAPPALDHLIERCLDKDPADRWHSAHDVMLELKWLATTRANEKVTPTTIKTNRERLLWITVSAAFLLTVGLLIWRSSGNPTPDLHTIRFSVPPPAGIVFTGAGANAASASPRLSPDGHALALLGADSSGSLQLLIRAFDSVETKVVPETKGASAPFWSPDSQYVAFFADGRLKKVEASGGRPQVICDAPSGRGGTWNTDGVIVFSGGRNLWSVSAQGGAPTQITKPEGDQETHAWPEFLPDGRHFLYLSQKRQGSGIFIASIDSTDTQSLITTDWRADYSDGHILFVRDRSLMAQPFDAARLQLTGGAFRVADEVETNLNLTGNASFSAESGRLAMLASDSRSGSMQLLWFDRTGKQVGVVGAAGDYTVPGLSPDDKKIAVGRSNDIWVADVERDTLSRFTVDAAQEVIPVWSPDGTRILFRSTRSGAGDLWVKDANAAAPEELFLKSPVSKNPTDWSQNDQFIMFESNSAETRNDLWVVPVSGERSPKPFLQGPFNEWQGRFSPDGRWIAYASDESGSPEVYVQSFPKPGNKLQISTGGGADPHWRPDGRELFYISGDQKLMSVDIRATDRIQASLPLELFPLRVTGLTDTRTHYDVSSNGRRFLVVTLSESGAVTPITVVLNWAAPLRR